MTTIDMAFIVGCFTSCVGGYINVLGALISGTALTCAAFFYLPHGDMLLSLW